MFTVKVDGEGARKILEAFLKAEGKAIHFLQSSLEPRVWHVVVSDGNNQRVPLMKRVWLSHDLPFLDSMIEVMQEYSIPLFGKNPLFLTAKKLQAFLADSSLLVTGSSWVVAVTADALETLRAAGCKFEIVPPQGEVPLRPTYPEGLPPD